MTPAVIVLSFLLVFVFALVLPWVLLFAYSLGFILSDVVCRSWGSAIRLFKDTLK